MASTVPAKSNNPLHNFDLPHLKWKKNHHHHSNNSNHTRRRSTSSPSRHDSPQRQSPMRESHGPARHSPARREFSPMRDPVTTFRQSSARDIHAPTRQSPMRDSVTERVSPMRDSKVARVSPMRDSSTARVSQMHCESSEKERSSVVEYRRNSRISSSAHESITTKKGSICDNNKSSDINKKHNKVVEIEGRSSSKILLKIPRKSKTEEIAIHEEQQMENNESQSQADEEATKTWNLRPRKPIHKSLNLNGGPFRSTGSAIQESKSQLPNTNVMNKEKENNESNAVMKKEKRLRFSVALTREEIDEDIYAMTGSKAARRPKKRVKAVQKQLDTLFPGLWLASITPDSYKVCENLPKG